MSLSTSIIVVFVNTGGVLFPAHVYVHRRPPECLHAHQVYKSHHVVVNVVVAAAFRFYELFKARF